MVMSMQCNNISSTLSNKSDIGQAVDQTTVLLFPSGNKLDPTKLFLNHECSLGVYNNNKLSTELNCYVEL